MRTRSSLILLLIVAVLFGFTARTLTGVVNRAAVRSHVDAPPHPQTAVAPSGGRSDAGGRSDVDLRPLEVFYSVLKIVREEYVEPIEKPQEKEMVYASLRLMLDSLHDPLTRFLNPDQVRFMQDAGNGKFHGIGAVIRVTGLKQSGFVEEQLTVLSVIPGSPAEAAGVRSGDVVTEVDGKTVLPYDPYQRVQKLLKDARKAQTPREKLIKLLDAENHRIKNGMGFQRALDTLTGDGVKDIPLTISRAGAKSPLKLKARPSTTPIDPVTWGTARPDVVCVKVSLLNAKAAQELEEAIAGFKRQGYRAIVLDLRDSAGGSADGARAAMGYLAPGKALSTVRMAKAKKRVIKADAPAAASVWTGPVVVLVNRGTSGLAEVVAAALREGRGAKLVGEQTSGQSLEQTFVELADGSGVTITTGNYLTPSGKDFRGVGLAADVKVTGADVQLAKAMDLAANPVSVGMGGAR